MAETKALCEEGAPAGTRVTTFVADVSDEAQILAFRDAVASEHSTDHINLLFNNAGIGGGGSFVDDDRDEWDKTFGVCWGGVYNGCRAFMPMLLASTEGHVVNTSSVNGFWASLGPMIPHTAYSAAKFAVKGFTEALISDFRLNAPHLRASVVMPGHIGTSIAINSSRLHGRDPKELDRRAPRPGARPARRRWASTRAVRATRTSADDAAACRAVPRRRADDGGAGGDVILDGVRANEWRILVGEDAKILDSLVREDPTSAYDAEFLQRIRDRGAFDFTDR